MLCLFDQAVITCCLAGLCRPIHEVHCQAEALCAGSEVLFTYVYVVCCCSVRASYHPSAFESSLTRHREDAAAVAQQLAEEIREGRLDPASPGFNQGLQEPAAAMDDGEPVGPAAAPEGPVCLWSADRAAADYKLAKRLVAVVDHQRGLQLAHNPLLPKVEAAQGTEAGADAEQPKGGYTAILRVQGTSWHWSDTDGQ